MVAAVSDSLAEIPLSDGPIPVSDVAGVQVRVGPGHLGLVLAGQRDLRAWRSMSAHCPPVARTAHAWLLSASLSTSVRFSGLATARARRASSIASAFALRTIHIAARLAYAHASSTVGPSGSRSAIAARPAH